MREAAASQLKLDVSWRCLWSDPEIMLKLLHVSITIHTFKCSIHIKCRSIKACMDLSLSAVLMYSGHHW